jgi:hypothetical protein
MTLLVSRSSGARLRKYLRASLLFWFEQWAMGSVDVAGQDCEAAVIVTSNIRQESIGSLHVRNTA